jgi:hypothetical protein
MLGSIWHAEEDILSLFGSHEQDPHFSGWDLRRVSSLSDGGIVLCALAEDQESSSCPVERKLQGFSSPNQAREAVEMAKRLHDEQSNVSMFAFGVGRGVDKARHCIRNETS